MSRILLSMAGASASLLVIAMVLGFQIDDPTSRDPAVQDIVSRHMLVSLAALVFASFVHALVLTYFMGTGRWIEETSNAYGLSPEFGQRNRSLKYLTILPMVGCIVLLVATGATGTAVDPASPVSFSGWSFLSGVELHLVVACVTLAANLLVNVQEYRAISRNGQLVTAILGEVHRIRSERGLPV